MGALITAQLLQAGLTTLQQEVRQHPAKLTEVQANNNTNSNDFMFSSNWLN